MAQAQAASSPVRVTDVDQTRDESALADRAAEERGHTFISDEVVSVIAMRAAERVDGIHKIGESNLRSVFGRLGRHHGVEAEVGLKEAAVDVEVVIEFGYPIREVARELRRTVIDTVESMTGRTVVEVDVSIVDVHIPESSTAGRRRLE